MFDAGLRRAGAARSRSVGEPGAGLRRYRRTSRRGWSCSPEPDIEAISTLSASRSNATAFNMSWRVWRRVKALDVPGSTGGARREDRRDRLAETKADARRAIETQNLA